MPVEASLGNCVIWCAIPAVSIISVAPIRFNRGYGGHRKSFVEITPFAPDSAALLRSI